MSLIIPASYGGGSCYVKPGIPRVNKSSPLSSGLIGAYLPGICPSNLVNDGADGPTLKYNAGHKLSQGIEGAGALSTATNAGLTGLCNPQFTTWNKCTLFWRGVQLGYTDDATYCGITYDSASNSPVAVFFMYPATETSNKLTIGFNAGGSFQFLNANVGLSLNVVSDAAATADIPGDVIYAYVNGVQQGTRNFTSAYTVGSTAQFNIGFLSGYSSRVLNAITFASYIWNRALSANELVYLHTNPYNFLIWPDDDVFAELVGAAAANLAGSQQLIMM
jgi:hypothetical protein